MKFCKHIPNSPTNANVKRITLYIVQKIVFLGSKTLLYLSGIGEKTFLSTLNVMISQTVRNECVRFGGHVDIEVSYKILRLDVLKETPSLQNPPCFE
jgi:hypothetical protein